MTKLNDAKTIPTGLRRGDAALHCGIGATYFDQMVAAGVLPTPRQLGDGMKLWLRNELDEALFSLPNVTQSGPSNPCDRLLA